MKTFKYKNLLLAGLLASGLLVTSCSRDEYLIGGGTHEARVDMSTVEYLSGRPKLDTVMTVLKLAGMEDEINQAATFFAPTNATLRRYIASRNAAIRIKDENLRYTLDSLIKYDLDMVADSVGMYIFDAQIRREDLDSEGKLYESRLGLPVQVSLEEAPNLDDMNYEEFTGFIPEIVYYTMVIDGLDDPNTTVPDESRDIRLGVQTSGIITNTGILHVLEDGAQLFFHGSFKN